MRPLDESPLVWKFVRANDLAFVLVFAFLDIFLSFILMDQINFVVGLAFGLFFMAVVFAYFFLKTIMPTNFLANMIRFKSTPRLYVPGPEASEVDNEVKQ
jgi:hypothetical protein